MPQMTGLSGLLASLKRLEKKYYEGKPPEVVVGYTQSYALYVHEVPADHTGPGRTGKWKYLSDPALRLVNSGQLKDDIVRRVKRGVDLGLAMLRAGMRLQLESQKEVPVDTSALKASAFTAFGHNVDGKARAVFDYSEGVRLTELERRKKK